METALFSSGLQQSGAGKLETSTWNGSTDRKRSSVSRYIDYYLPLQQPQGAGASFNFEISKCTEATVRNFMQPPVIMNSDKTLVKWYKKQWLKNQNL